MPIYPEDDLIISILKHKDMYPTLIMTFDMANALELVIEALGTIEEILSDGHTRLFNTIRDTIIKRCLGVPNMLTFAAPKCTRQSRKRKFCTGKTDNKYTVYPTYSTLGTFLLRYTRFKFIFP